MLKLRPRKKLDPSKFSKRSKPQKACCAFCMTKIPRPEPNPDVSGALTGFCRTCSAWFIDDSNGKLGGEAFVVGLTLLAKGNTEKGMSLRDGVDYEHRALAYDGRRHQVELEKDAHKYGVGRMWYFREVPAEK